MEVDKVANNADKKNGWHQVEHQADKEEDKVADKVSDMLRVFCNMYLLYICQNKKIWPNSFICTITSQSFSGFVLAISFLYIYPLWLLFGG